MYHSESEPQTEDFIVYVIYDFYIGLYVKDNDN